MSTLETLRLDAGAISLNLIATVGSRLSPAPVERLTGKARLTEWLNRTGVAPGITENAVGSEWVTAFKSLREDLHAVVHAHLDNRPCPPAALKRVNKIAAAPPPTPRLIRSRSGRMTLGLAHRWNLNELLSAVARDAMEVIGGNAQGNLHECEGQTCDLVYLDTSRSHPRRWCSSAACGNKERVAQYRRRNQQGKPDL